MPKYFLTYQQQMEKLQQEKGLIINDLAYAEDMLKRNSYFALITGYKRLFKNKTTKKYKDGTKFEDIVALYMFDKALRELFLKYLCQVERHFRSLMSYYFCEKFGNAQTEYLDVTHYNYSGKNKTEINDLVNRLSTTINDSNSQYEYITHYIEKHHNVPLWVLLNTITFGSLSKMYMLFTQDLQIKVSSNFNGINESQMCKILRVLSRFRNVCAHNERLFSYRIHESIPDLLIHKKLNIPQKGTQYLYGKSDLFAVVIALRYLLPRYDFLQSQKELVLQIDKYTQSTTAIDHRDLLEEMGFPGNWKEITKY